MNYSAFFFFVAVSALSELLRLKHPTPGEKAGAFVYCVGGGLVIGFITPLDAGSTHYAGLFVATFGRTVGAGTGWLTDKLRVLGDEWRHGKNTKTKRP